MCRNSCKVQKYYDPDFADDDDYGQYPFTNLAGFWGPNWKVSFEVFINSFTGGDIAPDGYANIFHITATGKECCSIGDRYPAFLLNKGGFLHFATQIGNNGNAYKNLNLETKVWYRIEAEQSRDRQTGKVLLK